MKRIIVFFAVLTASVLLSDAQNIDPTVEVSRVYEGKLMEVHKPAYEMAVPDTLYRFDLDFDYSVFDNPYKGAYEFSPYMTQMKPSSEQRRPSSLYINAGAGYTLHPVFDILWSPDLKGPFSVDVYGRHRSYVGQYRALQNDAPWNGYDLLSNVGADFGYDWKKASLDFGASYYGVAVDDYLMKRSYNAVDTYLSLKSKTLWSESFVYDISLAYRYAADKAPLGFGEQYMSLESSFGPNLKRAGKVLFDVDVELASYSDAISETIGRFSFVPRYVFDRKRLRLDVGVRVEASMSQNRYGKKGQILYPDIRLDVAVVRNAMKLYVDISGGERLNTFASLLASNHHLTPDYATGAYGHLLQTDIERVRTVVGLEGRISSFFSYDLRAGYVNSKQGVFDAVVNISEGGYRPAIGYSSFQMTYAEFDWNLDVHCFRFDGTMKYTHLTGLDNSSAYLVMPSGLTGDMAAMYNWKKRIYAGVDCKFATMRNVDVDGVTVPGYADLGISAEYAMSRILSIWLRGGNLLNMEIQRNVFFAEKGINFTAGICLNF